MDGHGLQEPRSPTGIYLNVPPQAAEVLIDTGPDDVRFCKGTAPSFNRSHMLWFVLILSPVVSHEVVHEAGCGMLISDTYLCGLCPWMSPRVAASSPSASRWYIRLWRVPHFEAALCSLTRRCGSPSSTVTFADLLHPHSIRLL